ncbi:2-dehydropantoate 2-reductase [Shouchella tritolerans]|uniref:2-dehydropantoate 2-reductase n=1 Tax=Shouchella tritolerans TaxID=2979466 RepID=UPI0021E99EEA|nr:2-dehydropantoate 2-reductase [Shouchella tritolerans]
MKIAVIGAGAVGLFLAASFKRPGQDVVLVTKRAEQAALLEDRGISLKGKTEAEKKVSTQVGMGTKPFDLIVCAVKSYDVPSAVAMGESLAYNQTRWLFVQNGMGHLEEIAHLTGRVAVGVLEYGLFKEGDAVVEVRGLGSLKIAPFKRMTEQDIAVIGNAADGQILHIHTFPAYKPILEKKLIANACINPLTAITGERNGALIEQQGYMAAMKSVFHEAVAVLERDDDEALWHYVVAVCKKTANNQSSMLVDYQQGRKLELDAILGYLIRLGEKKQIHTPRLLFLYQLLSRGETR